MGLLDRSVLSLDECPVAFGAAVLLYFTDGIKSFCRCIESREGCAEYHLYPNAEPPCRAPFRGECLDVTVSSVHFALAATASSLG